jgi:polyhydroxyalkanoate synthesis regulator phasin
MTKESPTIIETFKKTLLAGLGAAVVTKDKVQEGLEDLVKQGKITANEAQSIAERVAADGKKEFEHASKRLGDKVKEVMSYADTKHLPRIEALEKRVAALERKLAEKSPKSHAKS